MENIKKIYAIKSDLLKLFEKNNSVKDLKASFEKCDNELTTAGFILLNKQNDLLVDDMNIKIYVNTSSSNRVIFFVIFSNLTNSMFFPISVEKNCPQELLILAEKILDKTIYKQ